MSKGYTWGLFDYDIFTSKADGSDLKQLTTTPRYDAESVVSPDGKRLVFTSLRDGDLDLYTMNVDGTDVRRVTNKVGYDGGAVWSPDGKQLAWRAFHPETEQTKADYLDLLNQNLVRPTRMELWVGNADGSNARQVTTLGGANFAPFFTPDGKRLLFASNHKDPRSRNFDLYMVNLDGTGLTQVTTYNDFDGFPMFSPDGKKLVFASNRFAKVLGETNVFIAEWKGQE
jgi:Tol biopolymer transport system component